MTTFQYCFMRIQTGMQMKLLKDWKRLMINLSSEIKMARIDVCFKLKIDSKLIENTNFQCNYIFFFFSYSPILFKQIQTNKFSPLNACVLTTSATKVYQKSEVFESIIVQHGRGLGPWDMTGTVYTSKRPNGDTIEKGVFSTTHSINFGQRLVHGEIIHSAVLT